MRLIPALILTLLPAAAFANCSSQMRICTYAPAGGDVMFTENCSVTQCSTDDAVFDYFRFYDGSYIRVDYTDDKTLLHGQLSFVPKGIGPVEGVSQLAVMLDSAPYQRHVDAGPSGRIYTEPCDDRCAGDDPDTYGQ